MHGVVLGRLASDKTAHDVRLDQRAAVDPFSRVLKIRLLPLKDLRNGKSVLELNFRPGRITAARAK